MLESGRVQRLRERFGPVAWPEALPDLQQWLDGPQGSALLREERAAVDEALQCRFGYHLMQLGISPSLDLMAESRISHHFALSPVSQRPGRAGAVADYAQLPLSDESVDLAILHHVLDYSAHPHQVLREVNRTLIAHGHVLIVGFNPWSRLALGHQVARLFSRKPRWRHRTLRLGRMLDWLTLLDMEPVEIRQGFYRPLAPGGNFGLAWPARWGKRFSLPWGGFYLILARKDVAAMTPLRPDWDEPAAPAVGLGATRNRGGERAARVDNRSDRARH